MNSITPPVDPRLDLVLERVVDVAPELVWAAWTQPELLKQWFTPMPWQTIHCEIDLRLGGRFHTVMRSPEGQEFPGDSCYLEIVPNRRLVWTNALKPGFRPGCSLNCPKSDFLFTAFVLFEPQGNGTRYTAIALHHNEADRKQHADMGFEHGWGKALDQLVALMKKA